MLSRSLSFALTIIIPLLYLVQILIIFTFPNTFSPPFTVTMLGIILSIAGIAIWIITLIQLRNYFGVLPQKQNRLKSGLYAYINHPMYIGIYLTFLGLSLSLSSWQGLFFLCVFMLPVLFVRAVLEDKKLV